MWNGIINFVVFITHLKDAELVTNVEDHIVALFVMLKITKLITVRDQENNRNRIKITGLRPGEKLYEELLNDECKTLPTHHKKIMIGVDKVQDYEFINEKINKIIKSANNLKNDKVVAKLKELIPEFISKNSSYQSLDRKASEH